VFSKKRVMIIPFMGGLGNQLFQYAAGINVHKFSSKNPKFSLTGLLAAKNTPRLYMLGDLLKPDDFVTHGRIKLASLKLLSIVFPSIWVSEKELRDFPLDRLTRKSRVLLGYFQRHVYVDAVATEIIKSMSQSEVFAPVVSAPVSNDIAVHIRFGDYLTNLETKKFHGLTEMSYYVNAVRTLQSLHNFDRIVLYSDDPVKAYSDFRAAFGTSDIPLVTKDGSSELEDLAGMSSSRGLVISNSTFSWWAAWIGTQLHECDVVAPRPWFAVLSPADENLLPLNWTVLNRELQP